MILEFFQWLNNMITASDSFPPSASQSLQFSLKGHMTDYLQGHSPDLTSSHHDQSNKDHG